MYLYARGWRPGTIKPGMRITVTLNPLRNGNPGGVVRDVSGPEYQAIHETGPRALAALGMTSGITHMEWFRRRDGSIAISEVAARPPGAQFTTLISYAHDLDLYRAWARVVVHDQFDPAPLVAPDVGLDDLCTVVYTGGTTGRPKGVLMTHRVWQAMTWIQMAEWEFPDDLRIAIATPLSHAAMSLVAPVLLSGGAFYVMEAFDPDGFFDLVEEHRITATLIVPVMLYALQGHPRYETADMSSMETIFYGASPMSPAKLAQAIEHWGPIFFQFFGQTEAPMVITHLKKGEHDVAHPERLASCGRPVPWMHVALLDSDNRPVGPDESGEICTRGPLVMTGYKDLPDETAEALAGDWLHTGDVGRFDDDGYLYIVDRTKDMVISGGFNVFPREVEDVISTHPAVSMVMVIGVPDDKWGEAVKAVVVLQPGHEPSDALTHELQQLVKDVKGSQQSPKSVDFVDALPLTPVGKPDKKAVRARYWDDADRAVS